MHTYIIIDVTFLNHRFGPTCASPCFLFRFPSSFSFLLLITHTNTPSHTPLELNHTLLMSSSILGKSWSTSCKLRHVVSNPSLLDNLERIGLRWPLVRMLWRSASTTPWCHRRSHASQYETVVLYPCLLFLCICVHRYSCWMQQGSVCTVAVFLRRCTYM